jgi:hypothetical protein
MIRRRCSSRVKPVSAHDCVRFVAMIPLIRKQVRFAFRHLPATVRQERIDDALAQAFVLFAHLARRKRVRLAHPTALARYAAYRVRSGRPIGSRMNSRDVLSRATQRRFGFRVISADTGCLARSLRSTDLLGESRRTTPAELAAIRIDFASGLDRLSDRQRKIALCLACGESTGAVARRFRVSCGRISQIRLELATRWSHFYGELELREQTASRLSGASQSGGSQPVAHLAASTPGGRDRAAVVARRGPSDSQDSPASQSETLSGSEMPCGNSLSPVIDAAQ